MGPLRVNLVMSGGGTRLPAYVGAIRALDELGTEIVRVAGASGGSVVAAFLAAGFGVEQLQAFAVDTDYRQFMDISPLAVLTGNGLCAGKRFEQWVDRNLRGARFSDLPRDLRIVATDILAHRPVVFSREATPDVRVAEAVRFSMSIPGYFACRRWRDHLLVDGALVPDALWSLYDGASDAQTIFVLLSATHVPAAARTKKRMIWAWEYAFHLVRVLLLALENRRIPAAHWAHTTLIKTGSVSGMDFRLTREQKLALVEEGYRQVMIHLRAKSDLFPEVPVAGDPAPPLPLSGGSRST